MTNHGRISGDAPKTNLYVHVFLFSSVAFTLMAKASARCFCASGLESDARARAAVLSTQARPSFPLSKLFEEYQAITREETAIWRNSHIRTVKELEDVTGHKAVA